MEEDDAKAGADLVWKVSPEFQVSATVNPDFGAVEVDDGILNLTAMETYFLKSGCSFWRELRSLTRFPDPIWGIL